jgi:hypothetical protein
MRWISVYSVLQVVLSASALNSAADDYRLAVNMDSAAEKTRFSLSSLGNPAPQYRISLFAIALDPDARVFRKPAGQENSRIYKPMHSVDLEYQLAGTGFMFSLFSAPISGAGVSAPFGDVSSHVTGQSVKRCGFEITYFLPK